MIASTSEYDCTKLSDLLPNFFGSDNQFSDSLFDTLNQSQEPFKFSACLYINNQEYNLIQSDHRGGYQSSATKPNISSKSKYKSALSQVLSDIQDLQQKHDLKNVYDTCFSIYSFGLRESTISFVFFPIFDKRSSSVQKTCSEILQHVSRAIYNQSQPAMPCAGLYPAVLNTVLDSDVSFVGLIESTPEKYQQSLNLLEEMENLAAGQVAVPLSSKRSAPVFGTKSKPKSTTSRASSASRDDNLDRDARLLIKEIEEFMLQSQEVIV